MLWRRCAILLLLLLAPLPLPAGDKQPTYPPPAGVRAAFFKLLDRPKVDLDVRSGKPRKEGGLLISEDSFTSELKDRGEPERVPVLVVQPLDEKPRRRPAVIALHGTGGRKEGMLPFLKELAKRGLIGVAIDARYHGARSGGAKGATAYNEAIVRAWKTRPGAKHEHPFYYDTVWDLWRTVDYLQRREDVDGKNLGMIGFSMGGIETWLAASADERIKVTVPAIAVQSFRWSLEHDRWQARANTIKAAHLAAAKDLGEAAVNAKVCRELWNKVIPGMLDQFDCPSMIRLFAPRPLLIVNGDKDANCPIEGARLAFTAAERAYRDAGAGDRLRIMVAEGVGHKVTDEQRQAALAWLEKWLK
jgi:dienelactone hydrolase